MENAQLQLIYLLKVVIFTSYVSFPRGYSKDWNTCSLFLAEACCQENVCDPQGRVHGVKNLRVADAGAQKRMRAR